MITMKQILLLVFVVFLSKATFAQRDIYLKLDKAESQYQKRDYKKALRTLNKRTSIRNESGYWCGNAAFDYNRNVNLLKANIYIKQEEYEDARTALNSIYLSNDNIDSIIIVTYQLEFGNDSLSKKFDSTLTNATIKCEASECYVIIPLSKENKMEFKMPLLRYSMILGKERTEEALLRMWIDEFRKSDNLELIKEKS
jgi:tetratricopeptide (TPR) repeat protein